MSEQIANMQRLFDKVNNLELSGDFRQTGDFREFVDELASIQAFAKLVTIEAHTVKAAQQSRLFTLLQTQNKFNFKNER